MICKSRFGGHCYVSFNYRTQAASGVKMGNPTTQNESYIYSSIHQAATVKSLKSYFIATLILFTFHLPVHACSCASSPSTFCQTIQQTPPDIIVMGTKQKQDAHGMDFIIAETIEGTEPQGIIRVWGDNGALCREYTSQFKTGDTLILALFRITVPNSLDTLEKAGDYFLASCGIYFLPLIKQQVTGALSQGFQQVNFETFKSIVTNCPQQVMTDVSIYPNPTTGQFTISSTAGIQESVTIKIFNLLAAEPKFTINISLHPDGSIIPGNNSLSPGLYIVEVIGQRRRVHKKLVIY